MRIMRLILTIYVLLAAFSATAAPGCESYLGRVSVPVKGLWDSIPERDVDTFELRTLTQDNSRMLEWEGTDIPMKSFSTDVNVQREHGSIIRSFSQNKQIMWAEKAELQFEKAPRWAKIPGVVHLVPNKGIPIQLFVTLMQMKMAGIKYGSLKHVFAEIGNVQTQMELNRSPEIRAHLKATRNERPPNEMIERAFHLTQTYSYFETFLTQSGHRIKDVRIAKYDSGLPGVGDFAVYLDLEPISK